MSEKINLKITFPIKVQIVPIQKPVGLRAPINVQITPTPTVEQILDVNYNFTINTVPIEVNISEPLIVTAFDFLNTALNTYVDEDRTLKTLLNYGEDRQSVVLNYRYGPLDIAGLRTIQLKLLQPVPSDIAPTTPVFLSREVAKSTIDKVRVRFAPPIDTTPYLRPKNTAVNTDVELGKTVRNVTLNRLALKTGSVGSDDVYKNKTFEDEIFRQWYSYDFNSSELNIDFTNYSNFIFYGSAAMRLAAFREKIIKLESIDKNRLQFLSSSTYTNLTASVGYNFVQEKTAEYAKEKENVIRSFDRYEQYLYFTPSGSNSAYSASFVYADTGTEYNNIGYWPKTVSGSIHSVYSTEAVNWYSTQSLIAQRFDEFNENNLINTIPTHIREDDSNSAYITFVSMVGHFFDLIKPYIDHMSDVWSRNLNPNTELSKDLINEIVESVGFKLPTLYSTFDLTNNILGTNDQTPRRDLVAEIYKRLLHNLPFFTKAKGTKTALQTFIKSFGITPQIFDVKEIGAPVTSSYYVFDEFTQGLDFDETKIAYVILPFYLGSKTLQFNCSVAKSKQMTVLVGDNKWALNVVPHPSNKTLGRFELASGSAHIPILSSSYQEIFGDELLNVAIKVNAGYASLYVTQVEGEDILHTSAMSENSAFASLWNTTSILYFGGGTSISVGNFDGTLDEMRLWSDALSDETILNTAFDPGSNAGDTYDAASDKLLIQLSFNKLNSDLLVASSSLVNESPYKDKTLNNIDTVLTYNISESDFSRYNRTVRQEMMNVGSSGILTSKIKVAPPPVFIDASQGNRLYRTKSIVKPEQKKLQRGRNKIILTASPTEIVNQNIIRNFGLENINAVLGSPTTLYTTFEKSLQTLKQHYQQYYYVSVDPNKFIRILSEFGSILNQSIDYFIPSKATILSGITIEQNILEQVKIPPLKNIKVYGKDTRRTLNAAASLTQSRADYGATFNLSQTVEATNDADALGNLNSINSNIQDIGFIEIGGGYLNKSGSLVVDTSLEGKNERLSGILDPNKPVPDAQYLPAKGELKIVSDNTGSFDYYKTALPIRMESSASYQTWVTELVPIIESTGSYSTVTAQLVPNYEVASNVTTYNIKHEQWNSKQFWQIEQYGTGSPLPAKQSSAETHVENLNKIKYNVTNLGNEGAEPYGRLYSRKLFETEINNNRDGGLTSMYIPALYDIPPSADFTDSGVYTYFNNSTGVYYFEELFKTPAYQKPLNASWDVTNQTFIGATTWSYEEKYNIYDVVYQQVTSNDNNTLGTSIVKSARAGNNLYYAFKTRPAYRAPTNNTAFYTGSVPSYLPPSLDKENWEIIRFTPSVKRITKRVIFDVFKTPNPDDNNFRTTTAPVETRIDIPDRYVDIYPLTAVGAGSYVTGEILVQNIATLLAMQLNVDNIRVRLYRTSTDRDADILRSAETKPTGSHGVLLDTTINVANVATLINPVINLVAGSTPTAGKLFYTINNLNPVSKLGITMTLLYFALEINPRIPSGYLPKHYKFFRSNSTATKRSNYVGCKNTKSTTIDGQEPIQIFLSEGVDLRVAPSIVNEEIITGGGGILDAT